MVAKEAARRTSSVAIPKWVMHVLAWIGVIVLGGVFWVNFLPALPSAQSQTTSFAIPYLPQNSVVVDSADVDIGLLSGLLRDRPLVELTIAEYARKVNGNETHIIVPLVRNGLVYLNYYQFRPGIILHSVVDLGKITKDRRATWRQEGNVLTYQHKTQEYLSAVWWFDKTMIASLIGMLVLGIFASAKISQRN